MTTPRDADGDGLTLSEEREFGGDPDKADTDGDQLSDYEEVEAGTSLRKSDTDDDGVDDAAELHEGTDPTKADTDGDGLTDGEELRMGFDPTDADMDDDGLSDGEELAAETDPTNPDSDDDGVIDGDEIDANSDPLREDTDGDGLDDVEELERGTAPNDPDTDGDGLSDYVELREHESDPASDDSDGDGVLDGREVELGTNITHPDTDEDNLLDGWEVEGETPGGAALPDADPLHKDVYLELVYDRRVEEFGFRERSDLIDAWEDMPVGNPDNRDGISLHITENDTDREFATDKTATYFYWNHYRDWDSPRRGVYHRMFVIPIDDRYGLGGQAMGPGKVSWIDSYRRGNAETSRWEVAVHELLHNVVGEIDRARTCEDSSHTCEGWLAPSSDKMTNELPLDLAREIEEDGLTE